MDAKSQLKVIAAGFVILRCEDQPIPRIKFKAGIVTQWSTLEKFETKAARNRRLQFFLELSNYIQD